MIRSLFSLILGLVFTLNFAQEKTLNDILAGPWKGFSSEQIPNMGEVNTGVYMKLVFNEKIDGSKTEYPFYGTNQVEFIYTNNFGTKTYFATVNVSGVFNLKDKTLYVNDDSFASYDTLPDGMIWELGKFKVTVYRDQDHAGFFLLKGVTLDNQGYAKSGSKVYYTTDMNYNPWKQKY